MIRRMIGAAIGARVAKGHPALGGATGAMLATAVPFVISRVSLPAMVVLGVGGYLAKRYMEKGGKDAAKSGVSGQSAAPTPPPVTP